MRGKAEGLIVATLVMAGAWMGRAPVAGQGDQAVSVLAAAREALGGEKKLAEVRSLTVEGRSLRTNAAGATVESEFEMAVELPDKYMRRDVLSAMGNMSIYRMTGFNGDGVINEIDTPPQLAGGAHIMIRTAGPGGPGGAAPTPEQQAESRRRMLASSKQDFARLALGMFAQSPAAYPLTFTYAGTAESPDGTADVLDVKGEGGFAARLFVDARTHLPLMLSWMDKEPLVVTRTVGADGGMRSVVAFGGAPGGGAPPPPPPGGAPGQAARKELTPEEREKQAKDLDAQVKEAEAKRKVVEFRVFYSDYQAVAGLQLPHRFQRSVDGKPAEEIVFERVKVNPKIDAKKFTVSK